MSPESRIRDSKDIQRMSDTVASHKFPVQLQVANPRDLTSSPSVSALGLCVSLALV